MTHRDQTLPHLRCLSPYRVITLKYNTQVQSGTFIQRMFRFIVDKRLYEMEFTSHADIIGTDENPGFRIISLAIIKIRGVSTNYNYKFVLLQQIHCDFPSSMQQSVICKRFFL